MQVNVTDNSKLTNSSSPQIAWETPTGKIFRDYDPTQATNQLSANALDPLTDVEKASPNLTFRWMTGGTRSVSCAITVGGKPITLNQSFTVRQPVTEFKYLMGSVQIGTLYKTDTGDVISKNTAVQLRPTADEYFTKSKLFGIDWYDTTVTIPTPLNYNTGQFCFLQLVQSSRFATINYAGRLVWYQLTQNLPTTDGSQPFTVLDGNFPYGLYQKPAGTRVRDGGPYFQGQLETADKGGVGDTPGQPYTLDAYTGTDLITYATIKIKIRDEKFRTYLMFKSDATDSCWVPLKYIDWSWKTLATYSKTKDADSNPIFTFDTSYPTAGPAPTAIKPATIFPTWTTTQIFDATHKAIWTIFK